MRTAIILSAVFVLTLLTSLLVGVQTAKAQYTPDGKNNATQLGLVARVTFIRR
jgi:hypothetical protein